MQGAVAVRLYLEKVYAAVASRAEVGVAAPTISLAGRTILAGMLEAIMAGLPAVVSAAAAVTVAPSMSLLWAIPDISTRERLLMNVIRCFI